MMQPTDPLFNYRGVVKAIVVAILSAGNLACTLLSPYVGTYIRIALACISLAIIVFAANTDLHLSSGPAPIVQADNVERMTVERPPTPPVDAPPPEPPLSGDRPATAKVTRVPSSPK